MVPRSAADLETRRRMHAAFAGATYGLIGRSTDLLMKSDPAIVSSSSSAASKGGSRADSKADSSSAAVVARAARTAAATCAPACGSP